MPEALGMVWLVKVTVLLPQVLTVSLVKAMTGAVFTVIVTVSLLLPLALVAVSITLYTPGVMYVAPGFCSVEVPPLPRLQQ